MKTHLTHEEIDIVVHAEHDNFAYYKASAEEIETYKTHLKTCIHCQTEYNESRKLYTEIGQSSSTPMYYKLAASILILFASYVLFDMYTPIDSINSNNTHLFAKNTEYEYQLSHEFRSKPFKVLRPTLYENFDEDVVFDLDIDLKEKKYITIYNNKEDLILEKEITSKHFKINELTQPGIYYWNIETDEEAIFHGSFYIKKED